MKKVIRMLPVVAAALAVAMAPSSAYAVCGVPQFLNHALGMFFTGCADAQQVAGYAYVVGSDATLNTLAANFICESGVAETSQNVPCQPDAGIGGDGVAGDGIVTVQYDWGGNSNVPSGTNCPNPNGLPGVGRQILQVVANDGGSLMVSVGFSPDFAGYAVEAAHPGGGFSPLSCSYDIGMEIVSHTSGLQADTFCLNQTAPHMFSDCDPDTGSAAGLNSCTEGTLAQPTAGNLYTRTAPCNSIPDARKTAWTPLSVTPGAGGSKCVTVTKPTDDSCAFIGATSTYAGAETSAMTGSLRVAGAAAASDKVAIKKAELQAGKLVVNFGTENEATIVGFNVYAGSSKLNSGLIQAKGIGSNDYSFEVGRGALKNERSITVEAVKSDGTSVRSGSVSVK